MRNDPQGDPPGARRPARSLRATALGLLSMREHSRAELTRKLGPQAESAEQLQALLDELERAGYLSEQRFVESLIRRRASRFGSRLIERELREHRVADELSAPLLEDLAKGDRDRALGVWRKRFGQAPQTLEERARQHRFLAQRGFDAETIAAVLRAVRDGGTDVD